MVNIIEVKLYKWTDLPYSFPIDCSVSVNHKNYGLLNGQYSFIDILIVSA